MQTRFALPLARRRSKLAAMILAPLLAAAPALAQSGPPIPSMPLPPSASDPAPVDGKAKPKKAKPAAKASTGTEGETKPKPRKSSAAASGPSYERPTRYVPEEFDRPGGDAGSRAKPFVSESGRAGMGMKF